MTVIKCAKRLVLVADGIGSSGKRLISMEIQKSSSSTKSFDQNEITTV